MPTSAHAAFEKGCYYFGLESRRVPVGADWRADVGAMEAAIDDNTVLLVGSAPQYPQGVIDPIAEIAALAAARDINCHVDACMGGVTLTYLARLGEAVPPWNFSVAGRHEHLGRPAQVRLHRQGRVGDHAPQQEAAWLPDLRHRQLARWHLRIVGRPGYEGRRLDGRGVGRDAPPRQRGLRAGDSSRQSSVLAAGGGGRGHAGADDHGLRHKRHCWPSVPPTRASSMCSLLPTALWRRGWYVDRQGPPPSLHCTVSVVHDGKIEAFATDLRDSIDEVVEASKRGAKGSYGTVE